MFKKIVKSIFGTNTKKDLSMDTDQLKEKSHGIERYLPKTQDIKHVNINDNNLSNIQKSSIESIDQLKEKNQGIEKYIPKTQDIKHVNIDENNSPNIQKSSTESIDQLKEKSHGIERYLPKTQDIKHVNINDNNLSNIQKSSIENAEQLKEKNQGIEKYIPKTQDIKHVNINDNNLSNIQKSSIENAEQLKEKNQGIEKYIPKTQDIKHVNINDNNLSNIQKSSIENIEQDVINNKWLGNIKAVNIPLTGHDFIKPLNYEDDNNELQNYMDITKSMPKESVNDVSEKIFDVPINQNDNTIDKLYDLDIKKIDYMSSLVDTLVDKQPFNFSLENIGDDLSYDDKMNLYKSKLNEYMADNTNSTLSKIQSKWHEIIENVAYVRIADDALDKSIKNVECNFDNICNQYKDIAQKKYIDPDPQALIDSITDYKLSLVDSIPLISAGIAKANSLSSELSSVCNDICKYAEDFTVENINDIHILLYDKVKVLNDINSNLSDYINSLDSSIKVPIGKLSGATKEALNHFGNLDDINKLHKDISNLMDEITPDVGSSDLKSKIQSMNNDEILYKKLPCDILDNIISSALSIYDINIPSMPNINIPSMPDLTLVDFPGLSDFMPHINFSVPSLVPSFSSINTPDINSLINTLSCLNNLLQKSSLNNLPTSNNITDIHSLTNEAINITESIINNIENLLNDDFTLTNAMVEIHSLMAPNNLLEFLNKITPSIQTDCHGQLDKASLLKNKLKNNLDILEDNAVKTKEIVTKASELAAGLSSFMFETSIFDTTEYMDYINNVAEINATYDIINNVSINLTELEYSPGTPITCATSTMMCSMGMGPLTHNSTRANILINNKPSSVITDTVPSLNITPCIGCNNPANPTAAAKWFIPPYVCTPITPSFIPTYVTRLIQNIPINNLNNKAMCIFAAGGVMQFANPNQQTSFIG